MTAPGRLLQLHGAIVDLVYQVDAVPNPGEEARVRRFDMSPGGGFNAMVAARRLGLAVTYAGSLGTGPLSDMVSAALSSEGIERLHARDASRDQGCCTVMIDQTGERTFVAAEGAEGHVRTEALQRITLAEFSWCLISGYTLSYPGARLALTQWLEQKPSLPNLVFDPAPIVGTLSQKAMSAALDRATWISANAVEATVLTGEPDPMHAAKQLAAHRAGGAVVRLGADGCILADAGKVQRIPGHRVVPVDTNGAGDAHIGAFIASMARGHDPADAARIANTAAALSTLRFGPARAPDLATLENTLRVQEAG